MPGMVDAPRMYRFFRSVLPPIVNPWLRIEVHGLEHVPTQGGAIIASNHLSFIDSICVPGQLTRPLYYLGKADYWDSWRTRWFFQGTGVVPVDRTGGDKAEAALRTGVRILESGELLGIYPEGTRSPDGRLYRGKTGPIRMAITAGVPIIPTALIGTDKAMPTGSKVLHRVPCTVAFGRPLDFSRYADQMDDPFALRSAIDELMFEIMMLSGQEYVDEYAGKIKGGGRSAGARDGQDVTIDVTEADARQAS